MSHAHKDNSNDVTASTTTNKNNIKITTRPVDALEAHEFSQEIYDQDWPNGRFIQSIKENLEKPIIINENNEVIDGVRRLKAAEVLGWDEIEVEVRSFADENEEREAILRHNDHRTKTFSQKVRVAQEFEELIAPVMEKKMKNGTGVSRSDLDNDDKLVRAAQNGDRTTRDLVGDRVGWSGETYRKAKKIWRAAHDGEWPNKNETVQLDQELQGLADELIDDLDNEEKDKSISSVFRTLETRVARSNGISWQRLRGENMFVKLDRVEEEVPETASGWVSGLEKTVDNYQNNYETKPSDEYLPLIMYLLEQKADIDIGSDSDVVVEDFSDRCPKPNRLEELYWDENRSREEIAVCYSVTIPVVNYWLRDASIDLKQVDAP